MSSRGIGQAVPRVAMELRPWGRVEEEHEEEHEEGEHHGWRVRVVE